MKNLVDFHTHTLACNHAYSTLKENIDYAQKMGIKVLGWSEHGYGMPMTTRRSHFVNFRVIQEKIKDVRVLCGMEANICNFQGEIFEQETLPSMDYVIASLHRNVLAPGEREENTAALLRAMDNPHVKILGHIDDGYYPIQYEEVVEKAARKNILIEVNNSSFLEKTFRLNSKENMAEILHYAKEYRCKLILNSDAHMYYEVGEIGLALKEVEKAKVPEGLILNNKIDELEEILKIALR